MPVPQIQEDIVEMIGLLPNERIPECIVEHTVDASAPQIREPVAKAISQDRLQQRRVERIVDVPVPKILEESVEVVQDTPQDFVQHRTVATLASKIQEKPVEVLIFDFTDNSHQRDARHTQFRCDDRRAAETARCVCTVLHNLNHLLQNQTGIFCHHRHFFLPPAAPVSSFSLARQYFPEHHASVSIKGWGAGEALAVLEGVAHKRLLRLEAAFSHLVWFESVDRPPLAAKREEEKTATGASSHASIPCIGTVSQHKRLRARNSHCWGEGER